MWVSWCIIGLLIILWSNRADFVIEWAATIYIIAQLRDVIEWSDGRRLRSEMASLSVAVFIFFHFLRLKIVIIRYL